MEERRSEEAPWDVEFRLPTSVNPEHYELMLWPRIENDTFTGHVRICMDVNQPQTYLAVHARDLEVDHAELSTVMPDVDPTPVELRDAFLAPKNDFYVVRPSHLPLQPGKYELSLKFKGSLLKSDIVGFYSSQYKDKTGSERKLVTSKFEPTYARRAFPCMDEPQKKATFTVSLVKKKNVDADKDPWIALSNMKSVDPPYEPVSDDMELVRFPKCVPMSTYLACFIISQFKSLQQDEGIIIDNMESASFELKTWSQPSLVQYTEEACKTAKAAAEYYIQYFKIPYPLPKLDLIAIPDFVSGAMENWGLVTFRETNIIYDPVQCSVAEQQRINEVVAHEVAHMWFGNLVTMMWWDDLWLNEGFATFLAYKAVNANHGATSPADWKVLDQFVIQDLQYVMALDAQLSSHPVIQHVEHPDQITELFDTITYSKGSSVLRMLENFLGEQVFQDGIHNYLKNHVYKNAATPDLWHELQMAADAAGKNVDVSRVMNTWTLQMGLPVVDVKLQTAGPDGTGIATLTQSRFLETASQHQQKANTESPFGYRWDIPVTWTQQGKESNFQNLDWLKIDDINPLTINITAAWIKLNKNQMGFYRVNYDAHLWQELTTAYFNEDHTLTAVDRSSLLDDAFSLAKAGLLDYPTALNLSKALIVEKDYIPWCTAATWFQKITPLMRDRPAYPCYLEFLRSRISPVYDFIKDKNPQNLPHLQKLLQNTVLSVASQADHTESLTKAGDEFRQFVNALPMDDPSIHPIDINLRLWTYTYGMQQIGNSDIWNKVWNYYLKVTDPQERSKLQRCLSTIRDITVLERYVDLAWNMEYVKGQDYLRVLEYISLNPFGTSLVWNHVRSNWPRLVERFTLNNRYLGNLVPAITKTFSTEVRLQEMQQFFTLYPDAGAGSNARANALECVQANIQWVTLHYSTIADWLNLWHNNT